MFFPFTHFFQEDNQFWLVLWGGSERGFAHIGVIRYLEEKNLRPTEISGTSMGAIIGACYATGKTSADMMRIIENIKILDLLDPSFQSGLIKGNKVVQFFEEIFGDTLIESTNIPLKIIATDIQKGTKKVFTSGKIVDAIRASSSLPWVFDPYEIDGVAYVDGGITENLPISVLSSKKIIASSALRDIARSVEHREKIFGVEFENPFKTSFTILEKSIDILIAQNEACSLQNTQKSVSLIRPQFPDIGYHELSRFGEIVEVGYLETKKVLDT